MVAVLISCPESLEGRADTACNLHAGGHKCSCLPRRRRRGLFTEARRRLVRSLLKGDNPQVPLTEDNPKLNPEEVMARIEPQLQGPVPIAPVCTAQDAAPTLLVARTKSGGSTGSNLVVPAEKRGLIRLPLASSVRHRKDLKQHKMITEGDVAVVKSEAGNVQPVLPTVAEGSPQSLPDKQPFRSAIPTETCHVRLERCPRALPAPEPSDGAGKIAELVRLVKSQLMPHPVGVVCETSPHMTIRKSFLPGSDGVHMPQVVVTYSLPDLPAAAVYNFLRDKLGAPQWHRDVAAVREVTQHLRLAGLAVPLEDDRGLDVPGIGGKSLRLWQTQYKLPSFARFLGLPPREVLEFRACSASDPDAYIIAMSSTDVDRFCIPNSPGHLRAHLTLAGYACIPTPTGGCDFRFITHMNPLGVPSWICDRLATTKPREFCEALAAEMRRLRQTGESVCPL